MMQLRKTCQHPYLVSQDLEGQTVDLQVAHQRMTEGSAKVRFRFLRVGTVDRSLTFAQLRLSLAGDAQDDAAEAQGTGTSSLALLAGMFSISTELPSLEEYTHTLSSDAFSSSRLLSTFVSSRLPSLLHRTPAQSATLYLTVQDWLDGEGMTYIRLDGDTPQAQRQKDMDRFNAPNSDLFLYLLSTRGEQLMRSS
jgi:SNF2 family DNA or RNA helicase